MDNNAFISSITLDGEEWRDIVGFEGSYIVSSYGRIISLSSPITAGKLHYTRKPKLLNLTHDTNGYISVGLSIGKNKSKRMKVHRIVAQAFLPNPKNLPIINHKDENKTNNRVDNLEWCTTAYNVNYGTGQQRRILSYREAKHCCRPVAQIGAGGEIIATYPGLRYAGEAVRRDYSAISFSIKHGGKSAGYRWKFL